MSLLDSNPPPKKPGVYQFKDADGGIIYIGKAKNLHNRVRSYFAKATKDKSNFTRETSDSKTKILVQSIADVEYIITDNELEALILENTLIKKHKPKYNIRLRDDKNYQFIKIDYNRPIAKIYSVRTKDRTPLSSPLTRGERGGSQARYFGPFTSGLNVRNTIRLLKRIFPYCQADKVSSRPCFNYQLHRCPGVCIGAVSPEEYKTALSQAELFLQGKNEQVKKNLKKEMRLVARRKQYEKAGLLRDQLEAMESLTERQKIVSGKKVDQDFVSLEWQGGRAAVNLFMVRNGRLINKENISLENTMGQSSAVLLSAFLEHYYADAENLPHEVFIPEHISEQLLLEKFLKKRYAEATGRSRSVKILVPKRGTAKKMLALGAENAKNFLESQKARFEKEETVIAEGLKSLQKTLKLKKPPRRIECFDISNIQGKNAVGSMVVAKDGRPQKSQYRKFKIKNKTTPDDYAMMSEALKRRIKHDEWPKADLWVMDGGRGQLNAALEVLQKSGLKIPVIALGKSRSEAREIREEKIFLPNNEPLVLGEGHPALTILQRLRDEAHRFAITYHRKVRSRELLGGK